MQAKIAVVIVAMAACGLALLAMRQLRTQTAHELAAARLRIVDADAKLLRVRASIAARVTPSAIAAMAVEIGPLEPVLPEAERVAGSSVVEPEVRPASREVRR